MFRTNDQCKKHMKVHASAVAAAAASATAAADVSTPGPSQQLSPGESENKTEPETSPSVIAPNEKTEIIASIGTDGSVTLQQRPMVPAGLEEAGDGVRGMENDARFLFS